MQFRAPLSGRKGAPTLRSSVRESILQFRTMNLSSPKRRFPFPSQYPSLDDEVKPSDYVDGKTSSISLSEMFDPCCQIISTSVHVLRPILFTSLRWRMAIEKNELDFSHQLSSSSPSYARTARKTKTRLLYHIPMVTSPKIVNCHSPTVSNLTFVNVAVNLW